MISNKTRQEKILTVIAIDPTTDVTTNDPAHIVSFGEYVTYQHDNKCEYYGKTAPIIWLTPLVKYTEPFPYAIGSKWKLEIKENNTINLIEP
ncbi:MAG: hypothetical protein FWH37_03965 [Candidatus Bathyarchaeota archaeon]|nr:hypothetical protein [Candidatus Termiticorpusculum sp.]